MTCGDNGFVLRHSKLGCGLVDRDAHLLGVQHADVANLRPVDFLLSRRHKAGEDFGPEKLFVTLLGRDAVQARGGVNVADRE
eukprot:COSAG04_NODE_21046_length_381_cov_0.680851_1_plen_81_part_01